jgi:carbamoyl-phosphate synthase large subunit
LIELRKARKRERLARKLNILFTCAGRRVILMEAFRRALKAVGAEGKIVATDVTEASAAFQSADEKVLVPPAGNVRYIQEIEEIVRRREIGLILPMTDLDLRSLARHREAFAEMGCTVMIGPEETIKICRDKKVFSQVLVRAGMPAIRTFSLQQFQAAPFYPCFVKPVRGSAGLGSDKIESHRQLQAHVHTFGEQLIVQDYVPGREYTVDVYRSRAGKIHAIVPRQRLAVRCGEVDQGVTIQDEKIIQETRKLADLLEGLWGVFCCQCRRPPGDDKLYFFEVNPRFGGGSPLSIAAGADLPLYVIQETLGLPVTGEVGKFTPNLLMLRYANNLFRQVNDPSLLPGFSSPIIK